MKEHEQSKPSERQEKRGGDPESACGQNGPVKKQNNIEEVFSEFVILLLKRSGNVYLMGDRIQVLSIVMSR